MALHNVIVLVKSVFKKINITTAILRKKDQLAKKINNSKHYPQAFLDECYIMIL